MRSNNEENYSKGRMKFPYRWDSDGTTTNDYKKGKGEEAFKEMEVAVYLTFR